MRARLALMAGLLAAYCPHAAAAGSAEAATKTATPSSSSSSCDEFRTRFYALQKASLACHKDNDCTCISPIDVSGGGLLGAQASAVSSLRALAADYKRKGCPINCRTSDAPTCQAHCADGTCTP